MILYTGGSFDVLHAGHVELLSACRSLADQLGQRGRVVVSLNTDEFIEQFKGRAPVVPYELRAMMLRAIRYVDEVVPNVGGPDSRPAIERVGPGLIAVGSDWAAPKDYHGQMGFTPEWLAERGIRLVFVPRTTGLSSSLLKSRMGS